MEKELLEKIVILAVKEAIRQLGADTQNGNAGCGPGPGTPCDACAQKERSGFHAHEERIDMQKYRTPVLTEAHLHHLHERTGRVIVPKGTVITPKARQMIRQKNIEMIFE